MAQPGWTTEVLISLPAVATAEPGFVDTIPQDGAAEAAEGQRDGRRRRRGGRGRRDREAGQVEGIEQGAEGLPEEAGAEPAAALPGETPLYVTADHGMVDVGPDDRIDVDLLPALREGVAVLGGEPRARHVYAKPGAAADVAAAWAEVMAAI